MLGYAIANPAYETEIKAFRSCPVTAGVTRMIHGVPIGVSRLMLTKPELCRMIVGLVEVNDADLLDQDAILSAKVCAHGDRTAVRGIRDLIHRLYLDFDYLASPRFVAETDGKSSAFYGMLSKRYSDPVQRTESRRAYAVALANILEDNDAYTLTKTAEHDSLERLRELLNALENPGIG